jgi:hypothetical protein
VWCDVSHESVYYVKRDIPVNCRVLAEQNLSSVQYITSSFSAHKYHNRYEFLADIERILENCILYNGKDSTYTQKAEKMVNVCRTTLDEVSCPNFLTFNRYGTPYSHSWYGAVSQTTRMFW